MYNLIVFGSIIFQETIGVYGKRFEICFLRYVSHTSYVFFSIIYMRGKLIILRSSI